MNILVVLCLCITAVVYTVCEAVPEYPIPTVDEIGYRLIITEECGIIVGEAVGVMGEQYLMEYPVPDYEGEIATPKGLLKYSFTNFVVSSATLGSPYFEMNPDDQTISAKFMNSSLSLAFDYSYEKTTPPVKKGSGQGTLDVFQLDVSVKLHFSHDPLNGAAVMDVIDATGVLADFNLYLTGSELAWIINAFISIFEDEITKEISDSLTDLVKDIAVQLAEDLHTSSPSTCNDQGICRDGRYSNDPIIGTNYFATQEGGQHFLGSDPAKELVPDSFPQIPSIVNEAHLQQIFSIASIQTFVMALINAGSFPLVSYDALQYGSILSGDVMSQVLPGWGELYPGMDAKLTWSTLPGAKVKIYPASAIFVLNSEMSISPIDATGAATLGEAIHANAETWLSAQLDYINYHGQPSTVVMSSGLKSATFEVEYDDVTFELTSSSIPNADLDTSEFYEWFSELFVTIIEPAYYDPIFETRYMKLVKIMECDMTDRSIIYNTNYIMIGGKIQDCV